MPRPPAVRIAMALLLATGLAAIATLVGAAVLASDYRPSYAEGWSQAEPVRNSNGWDRWHRWSAVASVLAGVAAVLPLLVLAARGTVRRAWLPLSAGVVAAGAAAVALATRPLVQFEQLALHAVTVGDDIAGYWFAAFDDGIRFVIVDGTEVSQGSYAAALLVHLVTPGIAAAGAAVASIALLPGSRRDPETVATLQMRPAQGGWTDV